MSRNDTIELLNETDRLSARLDWQLFQYENAAVVYGDGSGWQPGEPLYKKPVRTVLSLFDDGPDGNWVRPMIEEIPADEFNSSENTEHTYGYCHYCTVGWRIFTDPCWLCGQQNLGPLTRFNDATMHFREDDSEGFEERYSYDHDEYVLECLQIENNTHQEILKVLLVPAVTEPPVSPKGITSLSGFSLQHVIYDEAGGTPDKE